MAQRHNLTKAAKTSNVGCTPAQIMKAELLTVRMDFQQEIRERAYEIYCNRNASSATALDDWLNAEQEIKAWYANKRGC